MPRNRAAGHTFFAIRRASNSVTPSRLASDEPRGASLSRSVLPARLHSCDMRAGEDLAQPITAPTVRWWNGGEGDLDVASSIAKFRRSTYHGTRDREHRALAGPEGLRALKLRRALLGAWR
jgi:hypothetical protein